jgi:hypothetical protein
VEDLLQSITRPTSLSVEPPVDPKALHAKIGQAHAEDPYVVDVL